MNGGKRQIMPSELTLNISHQLLPLLFGELDQHKKKIEQALDVTIVERNDQLKVIGEDRESLLAKKVVNRLMHHLNEQGELSSQTVDYTIDCIRRKRESDLDGLNDHYVCKTVRGQYIRPKTVGQKRYLDLIDKKMIVFGIGPAGTGKTYLAMAKAITAFKNNEVQRIIMTRPAIEAGEKLGFLPGDLQSKVDPYLRPLYDALYEIMGAESYLKNMEKGLIEVAPLAYMRGRTLDNAYIILDEAQNTTPAQMKMFLTRIGFGSKAVITGDVTQKDLQGHKLSGLESATKILDRIDKIGICRLTSKDVVRHPLVQQIIEAYERAEKKEGNVGKKKFQDIKD